MENNEINLELLEYKYKEVIDYYRFDFGSIPKHIVNEINAKLTDPYDDRNRNLESVIRLLYIDLINKNVTELNKNIDKKKTVDFSNNRKEIRNILNEMKNPKTIDDLRELYINLRDIRSEVVEKGKVNTRNFWINIIINAFFLVLGVIIGYFLK